MPNAAPRLCSANGCPHDAVRHGRCRAHMTQEYARIERYRGTATSRGYDHAWTTLRNRYIKAHPFCVVCDRNGVLTLAAEVDHITPLARGGERLNPANLQALCRSCHQAKTGRENRGRA